MLIEQGKGPVLSVLSAGLRFRNEAGQPELCPEVLTFRRDKLFKEGHTLVFLEYVFPISCLLPH